MVSNQPTTLSVDLTLDSYLKVFGKGGEVDDSTMQLDNASSDRSYDGSMDNHKEDASAI